MRLRIVTPLTIAVDDGAVVSLKAEDESGSFGILSGHADFLTTLAMSVVSWKDREGRWRHCAVRGGVLTIEGGRTISVTSREAVPGDDIEHLDRIVLRRFRAEAETERSVHTDSTRLQLTAIRQIMQQLRRSGTVGAPA